MFSAPNGLRAETLAVHAGRRADPTTGAVAPPIHLSTTFERDADGGYPRGFAYATFDNPNRAWLEAALTELEGGAAAVSTASGMSAIAGILSALAAGDHVIVAPELFQGTARLLNDQVRRWGVEFDVADTGNVSAVEAAITPRTRMIWVDTPSNPLVRLSDIAALSALARSRGIFLAVDSTFATFILQKPLALGADAVVYAATKYLSGHTDVVNGAAVFRERGELFDRARAFQINVGATPSPFDCWLAHRGLRTLPLRMRAHSANALAIAGFLDAHPQVTRVFYSGLRSDPQWELAQRQMPHGVGGMLSFTLRDAAAARAVAARTKLFIRAASLGGVESLIEHRASSPIQTRGLGVGPGVSDDLLRLSIGVEHADDLIADLDQALHGSFTG